MHEISKTSMRLGSLLAMAALASGCLDSGGDTIVAQSPPPPGGNAPPTISGSPQSAVVMGNTYEFTPNASDPDNDPLTFSVSSLPGWASFDESTGRISGTPTLGDVGTTGNILITVSDGQASSSLPMFSVTVSQVSNGSVTLSWTAPTQQTDGTPLTDLAGYRIYYGQSAGNLSSQIVIDNAGMTSYVVDNLAPATYFFAASSVNSTGMESALSNTTSITVN